MAATVLIIEDYSTHRALLRRAVGELGCQVVEAADGRSGLALAAEQRPTLIVLDLVLPDLDGLEVLRRLRSEAATAHTPILIVSAVDDGDRIVEALEAGADDYITKPFETPVLQARAKVLIRTARLQNALSNELRRAEATALMARAAASSNDLEDVCADVAAALRLEANVARAYLFLHDAGRLLGPYGLRGVGARPLGLETAAAAAGLRPLLFGERRWLRMRGDELEPLLGRREDGEVVVLPLQQGEVPVALAVVVTSNGNLRESHLEDLAKLGEAAALAIAAVHDRVRRSETEFRYRLLFDQTADGVALVDPLTGKLREVNQTLAQWLSAVPAGVVGKRLPQIFCPTEAERIRDALNRVGQGRELIVDDIQLGDDEETRVVQMVLQPVRHATGTDLLLLARDRAGIEMRGRFEQTSRDLADLSKTVRLLNHSINNPLTCIIGLTQLLQIRLRNDPEHLPQLETILVSAERITELSRQLREVAIALGGDAPLSEVEDLIGS